MIHNEHVFAIYPALSLKDGNGRELRRLNDAAATHLRALKVLDYDPSGPFVTSILELKLDSTTFLNGRGIATILEWFLIIETFWNSWTFERVLPRIQ